MFDSRMPYISLLASRSVVKSKAARRPALSRVPEVLHHVGQMYR